MSALIEQKTHQAYVLAPPNPNPTPAAPAPSPQPTCASPDAAIAPASDLYTYEHVERIADYLREETAIRPKVGIICGTGLGGLAELIQDQDSFPYEKIPDFPHSTVKGHSGRLVFGNLAATPVVAMQGRFHPYEGYSVGKCAMPVRVMKLLGVKYLIVTNAAGGLNTNFSVGDIMIIRDHINLPGLSGESPLRGSNDERWGTRFPAMQNAYDPGIIGIAREAVSQLHMESYVREGTYVMVGGPNYETIAENKFLSRLGADAVGMSTVHEVIVAHHCGLKVLGFSLITNLSTYDYNSDEIPTHEEVVEMGQRRARDLERLITKIIENGELIN